MSLAIQTVSTVQPDSPILQRWQDQIRTARAEEKALVITGAGSKSFYGLPIEGEALDTRDYRGIIDYEPTELVMTARCGTPLSEIEATFGCQWPDVGIRTSSFWWHAHHRRRCGCRLPDLGGWQLLPATSSSAYD